MKMKYHKRDREFLNYKIHMAVLKHPQTTKFLEMHHMYRNKTLTNIRKICIETYQIMTK